jgi:hypothetical protein
MMRSWSTFKQPNSWNSLQNKPAILSDNQISWDEIVKPNPLLYTGFTSLGGDANHPAIKIKELRGFTAATEGGSTYFLNGVNRDKILALSALVLRTTKDGRTQIFTPCFSYYPGYYFEFYVDNYHYTIVHTHPNNSESILSKEIVVTILYKV